MNIKVTANCIVGPVEIGEISRGNWSGVIARLPFTRTYIPAQLLKSSWQKVGENWQFLILEDGDFLPDRFTEGDLEYVKLSVVLGGRVLCTENETLDGFANKLLAGALVFVKPGPYSIGQRQEWERMIRGHLRRVGFEIEAQQTDSSSLFEVARQLVAGSVYDGYKYTVQPDELKQLRRLTCEHPHQDRTYDSVEDVYKCKLCGHVFGKE
jgi:hypothetical protein